MSTDRRIEHLELTREGERNYRKLAELARAFEAGLKDMLGEKSFAELSRGLAAVEKQLGTDIF